MSVWKREEAGLLVEESACTRWSLEHCANQGSDPQFYDCLTTEDTEVSGVNPGVPVEAKVCAHRVSDGSGSRRGLWWISRYNHEQLFAANGLYALGVYHSDSGAVLRLALLDVETVDELLSWWPAGDGHHSHEQAQLRWPTVFQSGLDVEIDAVDAEVNDA